MMNDPLGMFRSAFITPRSALCLLVGADGIEPPTFAL